jgi:hypothetical protein
MQTESEQKLKLSTSNIIALTAVLLTFIGGYINIKSTQTEFNQRITALEKANEDNKAGFAKFDFKLDKISESLNQLKVDMAGQRVLASESKP